MPATTIQSNHLTLKFDLTELPSAQHRAALAGLVLFIDFLEKEKQTPKSPLADRDIPTVAYDRFTATVTLTEASLQTLFDEHYAAQVERIGVASKWPGKKDPIDVIEVEVEVEDEEKQTKKITKQKRFIYEVVVPHQPFLMKHFSGEENLWMKLWRDMLYAIPRAQPATRTPFDQRAENKPCSDAGKSWKELSTFVKDWQKGRVKTVSLAGSLLLGAQDANAEGISFLERADYAFLLHFWTIACLVYVPSRIQVDYVDPAKSKVEAAGYSLAIPEVTDLEVFVDEWLSMLNQLNANGEKSGYRPKLACIELPEQASLESLDHLASIAAARAERNVGNLVVASIEYRHMVREGNNVRTLGNGRLAPSEQLMARYKAARDNYHNLVFRAAVFRQLLENHRDGKNPSYTELLPWQYLLRDLEKLPTEFFLREPKTPWFMKNFRSDVLKCLEDLKDSYSKQTKEDQMLADAKPVELLIKDMVWRYLDFRCKDRVGISYDDFKDKKRTVERDGKTWQEMDVPGDYAEAKQHIAKSLFLEFRARHDQAFVDHFVACFGATPQGAISQAANFQEVLRLLFEELDRARAITLLAISANA